MRKVVLAMLTSLDGFIEGPNKQFVPPPWSGEMETAWVNGNLDRAGILLYGRVSYQMNAAFWSAADTDPSSPAAHISHAATMNRLPKIVFSRTLREATWNARIVHDGLAEEIARLKREPGGDLMMFGGAGIANSFMRLGLFDEYRILVTPMVLGGGTPLFQGGYGRFDLKLAAARALDTGSVLLTYTPPRP